MANHVPEIKDIDTALLTGLVRQALDIATAEITHWEHHPVRYIKTEESNLGLHRFHGMAEVEGETRAWSMVLKAVHAPFNAEDSTFWNYHRREMLIYKDGLLTELPGGLQAPRCLGITEHTEGFCWLWMEDIQDSASRNWTLAEYGLAARRLGRFNGAYLVGHPIPERPWLSRNWLRGWLKHYDKGCLETLDLLCDTSFWEHPLLRSSFPQPITDAVLKLWSSHEQLLTTLTQLPQTFCYMDAYRPNLFIRRTPQDTDETVAIDWVFAGPGGLGEEIANLLPASLIWLEYDASDAINLDAAVFLGYLNGLRDAGWHGDYQLARLGYTAACALRWGVIGLWWLDSINDATKASEFETHWKRSMPELVQQWAHTTCYVLGMAEEAYKLQRLLF